MDYTKILIYIAVGILVIAIIYYIYKHYQSEKISYYDSGIIVEEKQNAMKEKTVRGSKLPSPLQGNEYSVSMWLYINNYDYKYGQPKEILYRGVKKEDNVQANPHIYLHPTESTLMVRIKLQSETVQDPASHMKKVVIPDTNNANTSVEDTSSNISNNNVNDTNNNENIEGFYAGLGSNILDSTIQSDHLTHNYSIIDSGCYNPADNYTVQIKELFNDDVNNTQNNGNNMSNNIANNVANNTILNANNTINPEPSMPSDSFITNNPFIALFQDKFSKAGSDAERESIANEYASKFVDKSEDERKAIAKQFLTTLAHMFAKSMGLKVINNALTSEGEIDKQKAMEKLYDTCYLRNIPLQKWVNITVSVYQNSLDIFMDGKLSASYNLKGFPQPNKDNVVVTPNDGFDGYISNTKFFNMAMTPEKAYEIYDEGPSPRVGFLTSLKQKTIG